MEAKHTKGPWSATKGSSAGYDIICSEVLPVDVCVISKRDKSPEEISANISLISASPDLRDALKNIIDEFDARSLGGKLEGNSKLVRFVDAGRAALSKVEGGIA